MTVLFNVTDAIGPMSNHGITRTERRLASALIAHADVDFVAMVGGQLRGVERDVLEARLRRVQPRQTPTVERMGVDRPSRPFLKRLRRLSPSAARSFVADRSLTSSPLRADDGDVLISVGLDWAHGLMPEAERLVVGHGCRYVGFCYDLIPADHPEWLFPPDPFGFLNHFNRVTRVASSVLCISESTRTDFVRHFPDYDPIRVKVVPLGADSAVEAGPEEHAFAASLHEGESYAVYCATIDRRKNHQLLYRAAAQLARGGHPANFVLVGKLGNGVSDLMDCLRHDPAVRGRFVHVTNCDDQHLAAIYRQAAFAVYPSLYEGWGLGVTEALANGTPCLAASGSSLVEAGLGVTPMLHPLRTSEWVAAMAEYFAGPPKVPPVELPTWSAAADTLLEVVAA